MRRRQHRVAVIAYHGVVLGDLAIPLEIFGRVRDAEGRVCYDVRVCGVSKMVESEYLRLSVPCGLRWAAQADSIVVPGTDQLGRTIPSQILRLLRNASKNGARIASICTGAFILAQAGLLDGLRVTTHWRAAGELAQRYPQVEVDANVLYVDHGNLLTSAGAAAGMDLCLHLVRRDHGAFMAAQVARAAVMPLERSGGQAQFIEYAQPEVPDSMKSLLSWVEVHLKQNLSLKVLAREARMSVRTLSRHFAERVGMSPGQWILKARVRRAQLLLETTPLSVEQVACEAGFKSASVLREHFGSSIGVTPAAWRQSFRSSSEMLNASERSPTCASAKARS